MTSLLLPENSNYGDVIKTLKIDDSDLGMDSHENSMQTQFQRKSAISSYFVVFLTKRSPPHNASFHNFFFARQKAAFVMIFEFIYF